MPTAKELEGTGFTPEDYADDDFELWPENVPAINLFTSLQTQIRPGGGGGVIRPGGGVVGFDYMPFFVRMDRMKLSEQEYEWLFDDIRAIESVALSEINKKD